MADYLKDNSHDLRVGTVFHTPNLSQITGHLKPLKTALIDTIESSQVQAKKGDKGIDQHGRPTLIIPGKSKMPQNDLAVLAEAFCQAFDAMSRSIIMQTKDYTQMQQLDLTETHCVLQSTTNAIKKQKVADQEASELSSYEEKIAGDEKDFGWVMFGVGIAVMVITVASAFLDGGISLAAVPEEAGMLEMTEMTPTVLDSVENGTLDLTSNTNRLSNVDPDLDVTSEADGDLPAAARVTQDLDVGTNNSMTNDTEEAVEQNLSRTTKASTKSEQSWLKWGFKFGMKIGVAAGFGSPLLLKGVYGILVANKLSNLADAQGDVGSALSLLQSNNMYFQFLQQLAQREGSVVQEEVKDASEVIDTYSSITGAWKSISYGLANSV